MTVGQLFTNQIFDVTAGRDFRNETVVAILNPPEIIVSQSVYDEIESAIRNEENLEFIRNMEVKAVFNSVFVDTFKFNPTDIISEITITGAKDLN